MTAAGQEGSFKGRHFTSEVILWAREVRAELDAQRRDDAQPDEQGGGDAAPPRKRRIAAPGEDLTHYRRPPWNLS